MPGLLVPQKIGAEITEQVGAFDVEGDRFTAKAGTGFDPDNPQHSAGSDGLRYAIAIQQHRDARNYDAADKARQIAERFGYRVEQSKAATTTHARPRHGRPVARISIKD